MSLDCFTVLNPSKLKTYDLLSDSEEQLTDCIALNPPRLVFCLSLDDLSEMKDCEGVGGLEFYLIES